MVHGILQFTPSIAFRYVLLPAPLESFPDGNWRQVIVPSGGEVLIAMEPNSVVAFDLLTNSELWRFEGFAVDWDPNEFRLDASSMRLSPDETQLLLEYNSSPRAEYNATQPLLLDAKTGAVQHRLPFGTYERFEGAVFTPDSKLLVTHGSAEIGESPDFRVWNTQTGDLVAKIDFVGGDANMRGWGRKVSFALSGDGERLATGTGTDIRVWATRSGRLLADLSAGLNVPLDVEDIAFLGDNVLVGAQRNEWAVLNTPIGLSGASLAKSACETMRDMGTEHYSLEEIAAIDIPADRQAPCDHAGLLSLDFYLDMMPDRE